MATIPLYDKRMSPSGATARVEARPVLGSMDAAAAPYRALSQVGEAVSGIGQQMGAYAQRMADDEARAESYRINQEMQMSESAAMKTLAQMQDPDEVETFSRKFLEEQKAIDSNRKVRPQNSAMYRAMTDVRHKRLEGELLGDGGVWHVKRIAYSDATDHATLGSIMRVETTQDPVSGETREWNKDDLISVLDVMVKRGHSMDRAKADKIIESYDDERRKILGARALVGINQMNLQGSYADARLKAEEEYLAKNINESELKSVLITIDNQEASSQVATAAAKTVQSESLTDLKKGKELLDSPDFQKQFPLMSSADWHTLKKQRMAQERTVTKIRDDEQRKNFQDFGAQIEVGNLSYTALDQALAAGSLWDNPDMPSGLGVYEHRILKGRLDTLTAGGLSEKQQTAAKTFVKDIQKKDYGWFASVTQSEKEVKAHAKKIAEDDTLTANQKYYLYSATAKLYENASRNPNVGDATASMVSDVLRMEASALLADPTRDIFKNVDSFVNKVVEVGGDAKKLEDEFQAYKAMMAPVLGASITKELGSDYIEEDGYRIKRGLDRSVPQNWEKVSE